MSGISNVGHAQHGDMRAATRSSDTSQKQLDGMAQRGKPRMHERLGQALESAGVDEETRTAIQEDLTRVFEIQLSSGSSPPEKGALQESVRNALEVYGLNAEEIMESMGQRGNRGRPSGARPSEMVSSEPMQTLVELLEHLEEDGSEGADNSSSASVMGQYVLDTLFGIDEEA